MGPCCYTLRSQNSPTRRSPLCADDASPANGDVQGFMHFSLESTPACMYFVDINAILNMRLTMIIRGLIGAFLLRTLQVADDHLQDSIVLPLVLCERNLSDRMHHMVLRPHEPPSGLALRLTFRDRQPFPKAVSSEAESPTILSLLCAGASSNTFRRDQPIPFLTPFVPHSADFHLSSKHVLRSPSKVSVGHSTAQSSFRR